MALGAWETLSDEQKGRIIKRYFRGPFRKYWWQFWRPKPEFAFDLQDSPFRQAMLKAGMKPATSDEIFKW